MLEKTTASSTPAVTLATRCTPLVTMSLRLISTTSRAVSGARIGTVSENSSCGDDEGRHRGAGQPDRAGHRGPAAQPEPQQARGDEAFDGGNHEWPAPFGGWVLVRYRLR